MSSPPFPSRISDLRLLRLTADVRAGVERPRQRIHDELALGREEVADDPQDADGHLRVERRHAEPARGEVVDRRGEEGRGDGPRPALADGAQALVEGQEGATAAAEEAAEQGRGTRHEEVPRVRHQRLVVHGFGGKLDGADDLLGLEDAEEHGEDRLAGLRGGDLAPRRGKVGHVVRDVPSDDENPEESLLPEGNRAVRHDQGRQEAAAERGNARGHEGLGPEEAGDLLAHVLRDLEHETRDGHLPDPGRRGR
mmetsp:Transcript_90489/g.283003  ORF Transcript_90489/g.283003 Transcript_90489/m.283003 type:complete len:253 (+) Transcript_90489:188-946(+)